MYLLGNFHDAIGTMLIQIHIHIKNIMPELDLIFFFLFFCFVLMYFFLKKINKLAPGTFPLPDNHCLDLNEMGLGTTKFFRTSIGVGKQYAASPCPVYILLQYLNFFYF